MDDPRMDPLESQLYAMQVMSMSNTMPAGMGASSFSSWHPPGRDDERALGIERFPGNQPPPPGHELFPSAEATRRLPNRQEVNTTPGWKIGLYSKEDDKFSPRNKQPLPPGEEDRERRESSLGSREWDYKRYPRNRKKDSSQTDSSNREPDPQSVTRVSSAPPPGKVGKEPGGLNSQGKQKQSGKPRRNSGRKGQGAQNTAQPARSEQPPSKEQKANESLWDSLASINYLKKDTKRSERKKFFDRKRKLEVERARRVEEEKEMDEEKKRKMEVEERAKEVFRQNSGTSRRQRNRFWRNDRRRSPVQRDWSKLEDKGRDEDRRGSGGATVSWGQSFQHEQQYSGGHDVLKPDHKKSRDTEAQDQWDEYVFGRHGSSSQKPKFPRMERDATGERPRSEIRRSVDDRWNRARESAQRPTGTEEHRKRHEEQASGGFDDLSEQPMDLDDAEDSAGNTQRGTSIPSLLDLELFQEGSDTDMRKQTAPAVAHMEHRVAEDAGYPINQDQFFMSSHSQDQEKLYSKRGQSAEHILHRQLLEQVGGAASRHEEGHLFPLPGGDLPHLGAQTEPRSAAGMIGESFSETPLDQFSAAALANPFSAGTSTGQLFSSPTIPFLSDAPSSQNVMGTSSSLTFGGGFSSQSLPGPLTDSTLPQGDLSSMKHATCQTYDLHCSFCLPSFTTSAFLIVTFFYPDLLFHPVFSFPFSFVLMLPFHAVFGSRSSDGQLSPSGGVEPGPGAGLDPALQPSVSNESLDSDKVIGAQYIIPVTGFFCKVCSKFFNTRRLAYDMHCKSNKHINKTYTRMKHDSLLQQHQASKVAKGNKGLLVKVFNDSSTKREVSTEASHSHPLLQGALPLQPGALVESLQVPQLPGMPDEQQLRAVPLPERPRDKRLTEELLKEQIQHAANPQAELLTEQEAAVEEERRRQEKERIERELQERLEKEREKAAKIKEMEVLEARMKEEQRKIERLKKEEMQLVQAEKEKKEQEREREKIKQELLRAEEEERLKKEQILKEQLRAEEEMMRHQMLEMQREGEKLFLVGKHLQDKMLKEKQMQAELERHAAEEEERAYFSRRYREEEVYPEVMDAPHLDSRSNNREDTGHNRSYFSKTSGAAQRRRAKANKEGLPPRADTRMPPDQEDLDMGRTEDWPRRRRGRRRGNRRSEEVHDRVLPDPGAWPPPFQSRSPPPFESRSPSPRSKSPARKSPARHLPARKTSSRKSPMRRGPARRSPGRFSSIRQSHESPSPARGSRGSASPLRRSLGGASPGQIPTGRSSRESSRVQRSPPKAPPAKNHAAIPPAGVLSDRESLEGDISDDELVDFGEDFSVVDEVSG
ncbi:uncharacterized protein [Diadema setosum]|uniref:uncharacterized protein n=1 Tax=Diadema setosum TaxID=31175 RepID=UPI003B3B0E13